MTQLDRFLGCLFGGAIGDALGYPVEFLRRDEIVARHTAATPASLDYAGPPLVSDDTQMTLFVAEGLLDACAAGGLAHPTRVVARALDRWYLTQFHHGLPGGRHAWTPDAAHDRGLLADPRMHHARAPGSTIMGALTERHERGPRWSGLRADNTSKGCGAVMRAAPCGLVAATRDDAFALACDQGRITHAHPGGYLPAGALAAMVWDLVRGVPIAAALDAALGLLAVEDGHDETTALLVRARELAVAGPPSHADLEALGGGWVGDEALAIAVACALADEPAADVLWRAAAHGGDSDSTAAIAGNLIGAARGVAALPRAWLDAVELRDVIDRFARAMASRSGEPAGEDRKQTC
jgi:ADP-ribosylglycohydrolase